MLNLNKNKNINIVKYTTVLLRKSPLIPKGNEKLNYREELWKLILEGSDGC